MSLKGILSFDVSRVLSFDVNRILFWRIPPMLLKGLAGWFLASIVLQAMGIWRGGPAVFVAALTAYAFLIPDLVRRMRLPVDRP
jgi:hypothetical protein